MVEPSLLFGNIISLLDKTKSNYKLFSHKPAFTYEELKQAQTQTGFQGTEMKCLVLKVNSSFMVYVTIQGNKVSFDKIKQYLEITKIRLATSEELKANFGAEPGCAYPFGFNDSFSIFVDPTIYNEEWLLFSPALPNKTIQVKGKDLKKVFTGLKNKVTEINFNQ